MNELIKYFSPNILKSINEVITKNLNNIEEIRLRVNKPIFIKLHNAHVKIPYIITTDEILQILQQICENSIYSYQEQICNGYITIKGGHRVGICGSAIIKNNKVQNINYIYGLNFRIARQVFGCSNKIWEYVLDIENNSVYNTLIVSRPGAGKTTILRDLIRNISNGIDEINFCGLNVGLVDERGEIAAMYHGVAQNDVGDRTDIMDNVTKSIGMNMLIRSMAPNVISTDEIGNYDDVEAIKYATCSGIKGIFTAHGSSIEDLKLNPAIKSIMSCNIFERIIFLSKNFKVGKVYKLNLELQDYELY